MDYAYVAYTEDKRLIKGKISAANEQIASDALAKVGYRLVSLKPAVSFLPSFSRHLPARVKAQDLVLFSRQLALLTDSGVGIIQSLELLAEQTTNRRFRQVLEDVVVDLRGGSSLSAALTKHPRVFSQLYSRMVAVGEQTGELSIILRSMSDHIEREAAAMAKLKSALTYPAIVLVLAIMVIYILVEVALPPLMNIFQSFNTQLPLPTRVMLAVVNFGDAYGLYVLLALVALAFLAFLYIRSAAGRYQFDRLLLRLPIIGRLILLTELARTCRTLSLLFRSGLPLPEVTALTRRASGNRVIEVALADVEQDMIRGEGLSKPMSKHSVFLPLMVAMTRVGEEVGNLDQTLMTVAQNYEVEADDRMRTALSLIEPAMIILLGGMVGFFALSLIMSLYGILGSMG